MPRPGPRRDLIAFKASDAEIAPVDERAADETDGNQSEMIRRLLAYATPRMPKGWKPNPAKDR